MNWGAIAPALGTIGGAGLGYVLAPATGGLSAALPFMATGGALGGAAGGIGGQFAPKDMPPPMAGPPGQKQAFMPPTASQQPPQGLPGMLPPGRKGMLQYPFAG